MKLFLFKKCNCRICLAIILLFVSYTAQANDKVPKSSFYEIKIYHFTNDVQEKAMDVYLQNALLPGLHKVGISKVGVFKPLANDTAKDKLIYVFIPVQTIAQFLLLSAKLSKDVAYTIAASNYINAPYNTAPYTRIESILLKAFPLAPQMQMPNILGAKNNRIYELRSYESATEKLHANKVHMFNEGGEITLFNRLGFNAIFYASVVSGSHMPNLMYMTSFENKAIRDEKWKTFSSDPEWKKLSSLPEYQHNVSKGEVILMQATNYSDI